MKGRFFLYMLIFTLASLTFIFTGCEKKEEEKESVIWNFEQSLNALDFSSESNKKNLNNGTTNVTIRNKIENTVTTIIITEKNKKSAYKTVSIKKGSSQQINLTKNVYYKIELVDSKNHHYSKAAMTSGDESEYFIFDSDYVELEFKDRDFKPVSVKDNVLKFFGM